MSYLIPIVGGRFRPSAIAIMKSLQHDAPLSLIPEPSNPYDPNAIKIEITTHNIFDHSNDLEDNLAGAGFELEDLKAQEAWHLGYIPKEFAPELGEWIKEHQYDASFSSTTSGAFAIKIEERG